MKKITLLLVLILSVSLSFGQDMNYSRVRIYTDQQGILELLSLGVSVDDGQVRPGAYVTCEISEAELAKVAETGYRYDVLIEDVAKYYEARAAAEMGMLDQLKSAEYTLNRDWEVPDGFSLGSIGGFCSIDEMLVHLDSMHANYPDLISPVYQFDQLTHEGRPIYWLRLSDNPEQNEDEPEVLYTGMHHAREPIGMQHLLFYMYYLLENYDTDPQVQYIVNNTELYFVPVVNVDGYTRNILTNPNGGGQWRKNRRDNGDGTYGVDPNRNYGFAWGWDNSGSSPVPGDATYRGPSAFSEPCTQVMRDFCESNEFRIALNYHSYANLLLYAWGYTPDLPPDNDAFSAFADIMTFENGYTYGPGYTTIYVTNGSSDDWMYGEQETKDKIYAYTPEIGGGSDGFWPSPSRIIPLCQENMWQSLMAAKLTGPYAEAEDLSPSIIEDPAGYFHHKIQRLGLDETAQYTVYISPVNDAITSVGDPIVYTGLDLLETVYDSISYTLKPDIMSGDEIIYVLAVDNGYYTTTEVIYKMYGSPLVIFSDDGNTFENWSSPKWDITDEDFHSPGNSITDSPNLNYNNYETNIMMLNDPIDLTNAAYAMLSFWAKWEIEDGYDYVQVQASSNGQTWTALEGKYTDPGTSSQVFGEPVFDGFQTDWVKDEFSLEEFLGEQVYIRFVLESDAYVVEDGFYWDDLEVTVIDIATGIDDPGTLNVATVEGPFPNPAAHQARFNIVNGEQDEDLLLTVFNTTGQKVFETSLDGAGEYTLSTNNWGNGVYYYRFTSGNKTMKAGKLIIRD